MPNQHIIKLKPRIFVGSSVEGLNIARAIHANLEYDAIVTVWNQGIFRLSSVALDDLIRALDNFDFAVFVFKPDDIVELRDQKRPTVRDNVVFELGLFIGRLGRNRVFFVVPRTMKDFRLPSDLLGITPGTYDDTRDDGNLQAALAPFCDQIRAQTKDIIVEDLKVFGNESSRARRLIIDKPGYWEFALIEELLKTKLAEVNEGFKLLKSGGLFLKTKKVPVSEFMEFASNMFDSTVRLIALFKTTFEEELLAATGKPGEHGDPLAIKLAVERIASFVREMLALEIDLQSLEPPKALQKLRNLMVGLTFQIVDEINRFGQLINDNIINAQINGPKVTLTLTFNEPRNAREISALINHLGKNPHLIEDEYD